MKSIWILRSSAAIAVSFLSSLHSSIATKTPGLYQFSRTILWMYTVLTHQNTVNEDLYSTFVRYTHFSAAAYASSCPDPPGSAVVVQFVDDKSTDTQAFLLRDDGAQEVILSFRGTSSIQDFATDFNQGLVPYESPGVICSGCMVCKTL